MSLASSSRTTTPASAPSPNRAGPSAPDPSNSRPLVTIVEDDLELRKSIRGIFEPLTMRVAAYDAGKGLIDAYSPDERGCLILGLRLPDISGLQLLRTLHDQHEYVCPVVFISGHGDIATAVAAMRHRNVVDFLPKPVHPQTLLDCVQAAIMLDHDEYRAYTRRAAFRARLETLSARERQVLDALACGKSNKVIAADLGLSHKTVATHRANIIEKFGTTTILDVVCPLRAGM